MRWAPIVLLIFLFTSCSRTNRDEELSIFKYNESNGVANLDPAFAKDKASIWATSQIFNSLVKIDQDLRVAPAIAKRWEISDNGKTYIFYLRDSIFFHNHESFENNQGRMVVASDFTYSFSRLLDGDLASPGSWVLNNVSSFYHENDSIFVINLKDPFPPFLSLLSMQYCSVVPHEIADSRMFRSHPIGTGPFKFQYWKEGVKLILRKNKNYFEFENNVRLPYLDAISITFIKDKQSEFLKFLQGDIHFISGLDQSYKDEILNLDGTLKMKYRKEIQMVSDPFLNTEYLGFLMDEGSEVSNNLNLRKAINLGIDKQSMIKYLRNNIGHPAHNGFVPVGMNAFSEGVLGYKYDIDKAKEMLAKAGFPAGEGLEDIILYTTPNYQELCEYIQNQLKEIDININIEINPAATHRQMVATSRLNFFRASWIADYPDAENYLSLFYSKNNWNNGLNTTHFKDERYDYLYEQAIKEVDLEKRILLYRQMDQIILDNAVIVPLYYDQMVRFYHLGTEGFISNAQNMLDLTRVKIN